MQNNSLFNSVKEQIKRLHSIVQKSSTGLHLTSMHDCAQIISKMNGFGSWNELRQSMGYLRSDSHSTYGLLPKDEKNKSSYPLLQGARQKPKDAYKDKKVKKSNFTLPTNARLSNSSLNDLGASKESKKNSPQVAHSTIELTDLLIAKKYNPVLKTAQYINLEPQDTLLLSSFSQNDIFSSLSQQLKEARNPYIYMGSKSSLKLDPWRYIFHNNGVENLLEPFDDSKGFVAAWVSMLRYLYHEFNYHPSIEEAIYFLSLEGLVSLYDWLKSKRSSAVWHIEGYLSQIGILEGQGEYFLSAECAHIHAGVIEQTISLFLSIEQLYKESVFERQPPIQGQEISASLDNNPITDQLLENLLSSKPTYIAEHLGPLQKVYNSLVAIEIARSTAHYEKLRARAWQPSDKIWLFCGALESWECSQLLQLKNKKSLIRVYASNAQSTHLPVFFENVEQVFFGKLLNFKIPANILEQMLDKTKNWQENIWFEGYRPLAQLGLKEYFFWHSEKDLQKMPDLQDYVCEKCDFL